jgi:glutaredoxin
LQIELVMYTRTLSCPFVTIAERVLEQYNVPYREIYIDKDPTARQRVQAWTGFHSVPTLVITAPGEVLPLEEPAPLPAGESPRGIDRGYMLTEPRDKQLADWLRKHGLVE